MLEEELIDLADEIYHLKAEKQNIEVKAAHGGCPKRLYDTLSSFSNQDGGGVLLFGLDEKQDFEAVGVYDLQDLQKKVTEQCLQMQPPVRAIFTYAKYKEVEICSAEIPSIDLSERPCYYAGAGRVKGSYIRVGDADLPMTDYELYSYEAFRKHLHDDERPIERAEYSLLDVSKVERYILKMKEERPGFTRLSDEQIHEFLSITRKNIPTLAAIMNFGIYPQGYLPQLAIIAVVVPGTDLGDTNENGARFIDNKRIEGTLSDMLKEAMTFSIRNMKSQTIIDSQTGSRTDLYEYPVSAIREAILNALIHRDYSSYTEGTPIQLYFYSDRLEIHSPGGLYGHLTVEELGYSKPDLRNPILATMSEFLLNTENRYSGIPTMRKEMEKAGLSAPVFENRRNEFVVTFYNKKLTDHSQNISSTPSADVRKNLLSFCSVPRSRQEIAEYMGVGTVFYAMQKYVRPLLEMGQLKMTIPEKPKSRNQKYVVTVQSHADMRKHVGN